MDEETTEGRVNDPRGPACHASVRSVPSVVNPLFGARIPVHPSPREDIDMRGRVVCTALLVALAGCASEPPPALDVASVAAVEAGVRDLAASIARDLAAEGPDGWLGHFVDGPAFFMASDGEVRFPDFATATSFVHDLDARIASMQLTWGDLRIDPLTPTMAVMAAPYDERLTDTSGTEAHFTGYFTGLAVRTESGWKLRHLHWSSPAPPG